MTVRSVLFSANRLSLALAIVCLFLGADLYAQDFFRVAPGKLTESHAEYDHGDGCTECHELGGGVTDAKCLACHERLAKYIKAGRGMHPKYKGRCIKCHTEHKGRNRNIIDWSQVGGRRNFDHNQTGFKLAGKHKAIACSACHTRRVKSGRTYYPGLRSECAACHKKVHAFTRKKFIKNCAQCHPNGEVVRGMKAQGSGFDHKAQTGVSLLGNHEKLKCTQCHADANMAGKKRPRDCNKCHKNPHGKNFSGRRCDECHKADRKWKNASTDHDKTRFPLRGKHRGVKCSSCHRSKTKMPGLACADCHRDPHRKRFAKFQCELCHKVSGKASVSMLHDRVTRFPLQGKHKRLTCRQCHRGKRPHQFERFRGYQKGQCTKCHAHRRAHAGQFKGRKCSECHPESGKGTVGFDHDKTRFPLVGLHQELATKGKCAKCHPRKHYRTGKTACADCHDDPHRGQFGKACARCHSAKIRFKQTKEHFDHNSASRFSLTGGHRKVACEKCHENGVYRTGMLTCAQCHAKNDPHKGQLGDKCEQCHLPESGAPKFDHESMTEFALTGAHLKTDCSYCHQKLPGPQPVGWTKAAPKQKVDMLFGVLGRECAACHFDPHQGRYGSRCGSCHDTQNFQSIQRAVHDSGAFRLAGAHDDLPCQKCHVQDVPLAGTGDDCQACHREDDVHNNALGDDCGRCHSQVDWTPARFNHSQVGYRLRGAHRLARCRDCHGVGNFQSLPTDCNQCHLHQAQKVLDPVHTGEFLDCELCHNQIQFTPARTTHLAFPLRGVHRTLACRQCHPAGLYGGTPGDCADCHLQSYLQPGNQPNHQAAGFSTSCGDCHTENSWRPARYLHQTFQLRGRHRTLACADCHPGDNYVGAFGGLTWDCALCHGPGGPVNQWPADHSQKGYPLDCSLCHTESAWTPARNPP